MGRLARSDRTRWAGAALAATRNLARHPGLRRPASAGGAALMTTDATLARFVEAQENSYATALAEIRAGAKRSHWMWYIFPQLRGLGQSPTAHYYGIASIDEARAYLEHHLLGPRYRECIEA